MSKDNDLIFYKLLYDKCRKKDPSNITFTNLLILMKKLGLIDEYNNFENKNNSLKIFNPINNSQLIDYDNIISLPRYVSDFSEKYNIGNGGFGNVFLTINNLDKIEYAIKKIYLTIPDAILANLILNEIFILSRLIHPNIVRYHTAWIERTTITKNFDSSSISSSMSSDYTYNDYCSKNFSNESESNKLIIMEHSHELSNSSNVNYTANNSILGYIFYIQMEFCKGNTLEYYIKKRDIIDNVINIQIINDIVTGLAYIHKQGIIHRDIKPANIFLENDCAKIGDFGLATMDENTIMDPEFGSFLYLEPNIKNGKRCDKLMDIYSLGIIILELYSIFSTEMERRCVLENPYKYLNKCNLSSEVINIIKSCITLNRDKRITIDKILNIYGNYYNKDNKLTYF